MQNAGIHLQFSSLDSTGCSKAILGIMASIIIYFVLCRCSSVQGLTLFFLFCEINLGSISLYIWIDGTDVLAILFSMEPVGGAPGAFV